MSDSAPSVIWRLNELLEAARKAKAFARASWQGVSAPVERSDFTQWHPKSLDTVPEGAREAESLDIQQGEEPQKQHNSDEQQDIVESIVEEPQQQTALITEETLEQARRDAYAQGYQCGMDEATETYHKTREGFIELTQALQLVQHNMNAFYAPLKKLALHLAEQLVRGELTLSSSAIERLTKEVLKAIDRQGEGPIVIDMHPEDVERLSLQLQGELGSIDLRADTALSLGSVRVSIDDSTIEDLIENRLDALADALFGNDSVIEIQGNRGLENHFLNSSEQEVVEDAMVAEAMANSPEQESCPEPQIPEDAQSRDPESDA